MVRASACHAEGRGFEPRRSRQSFSAAPCEAVAQSAQVVGVLLVFTLMVGPPAAAQLITSRFALGIALAAVLAIVEAWLGIVLAWYPD